MPANSILDQPASDSRISGLWPEREPQPAAPPRLTLGPFSEDDELRNMRIVLRAYIQRHGADVVRAAVEQIVSGAL